MLALGISGIDLKTFALTTCFIEQEKNVIVTLNANTPENILLVEASSPMKINDYKIVIEKAKGDVVELFKHFKKALINKLDLR